jgi:hypothetical protein
VTHLEYAVLQRRGRRKEERGKEAAAEGYTAS